MLLMLQTAEWSWEIDQKRAERDARAAQAKLRETSQELSRAQGTAALLGSGGGDRIELRKPETITAAAGADQQARRVDITAAK